MRRYETIVIIDPDLSSEVRDPLFERIKDLFAQMEGFFIALEEWGAKKLAYEIKKKHRGYYARFDFCGSGALINEVERLFQIDDRVLKYMTVLLDKTPDIEHIKEELAEAAETAKAAEVAKADEAAKAAEVAKADEAAKAAEAAKADEAAKAAKAAEAAKADEAAKAAAEMEAPSAEDIPESKPEIEADKSETDPAENAEEE